MNFLNAPDPDDVAWLKQESILYRADSLVRDIPTNLALGSSSSPASDEARGRASTWVSLYPPAVITGTGETVLSTIRQMIDQGSLGELGIHAIYTTPLNRSGGVRGREYTPSTDGNFDPISTDVDPALGTNDEYRALIQAAKARGICIIGNLVPLHTGQGPDFQLALFGEPAYRTIYMLAEIPKEDWNLLPPEVGDSRADAVVPCALVTLEQAETLRQKGHIPGVIHSADASLTAGEMSGWSATNRICGTDGKIRRWVYLHFFKPTQPALNLDHPNCQALRLVNAIAINQVWGQGVAGLRLDAVPFSIEGQPDTPMCWDTYTPSAIRKVNQIASLVRMLHGFSFQELMSALQEVKKFTEYGSDLTYDFFTRTAYLHAALTGDAALLRLSFRLLLEAGIQPRSLVHDLQNHDELTYQLPELDLRGSDLFEFGRTAMLGSELRNQIMAEMRQRAAGAHAPWNKLYRPTEDGIATTLVGFLAAGLGINPYIADGDDLELIRKLHLLVARANAMQPGVFALSGWDLVGAVPLHVDEVDSRLLDGEDYRWLNRGGVDLIGVNTQATCSAGGLTRARSLYGPLPAQLADESSFAWRLKQMLAARARYGIAHGELKAAPPEPDRRNSGLCILAMELPAEPHWAVTVLNFGRDTVTQALNLPKLLGVSDASTRNRAVIDAETGVHMGTVDVRGMFPLRLAALDGRTLIIQRSGGKV